MLLTQSCSVPRPIAAAAAKARPGAAPCPQPLPCGTPPAVSSVLPPRQSRWPWHRTARRSLKGPCETCGERKHQRAEEWRILNQGKPTPHRATALLHPRAAQEHRLSSQQHRGVRSTRHLPAAPHWADGLGGKRCSPTPPSVLVAERFSPSLFSLTKSAGFQPCSWEGDQGETFLGWPC